MPQLSKALGKETMSRSLLETLETRQHFTAAPAFAEPLAISGIKPIPVQMSDTPAILTDEGHFTAAQVSQILAQAASQARDGQAVAVVDREGVVLGIYRTAGATNDAVSKAIARARTAGYFQSFGEAFTTRTARFIIQDHFPPGVFNTAGGPLYGVEFSSLPGSDVLNSDATPYVSGDPGGVPLYLGKVPAGGIGVAGDGKDTAAIAALASIGQKVYNGREESDFDESVALAGASGAKAPKASKINAMAPKQIQATRVFVAGLRLPFTNSGTASKNKFQTLDQLVTAGKGAVTVTPTASVPNAYPDVDASVYGIAGELKNTAVPGFGVVASNDTDSVGTLLSDDQKLTVDDVNTIIRQAVAQALRTRAGIRHPIGAAAVVHIAVVDRDGGILGVFRENDGTLFSYDVAVQKARTAAFFSDDTHAFSTRAIGFMSQKFFPAGIDKVGGTMGPLFGLQNNLSLTPGNLGSGPLANGITIFPGGIPLYKNGVLVGAIGISGDGVDQDDFIAHGGSIGFEAPTGIRSDSFSQKQVSDYIVGKVQKMETLYTLGTNPTGQLFDLQAKESLAVTFTRLPYQKFPRNPLV